MGQGRSLSEGFNPDSKDDPEVVMWINQTEKELCDETQMKGLVG